MTIHGGSPVRPSGKQLTNGVWETSIHLPGGRRFRRRYQTKAIAEDVYFIVKDGIAKGELRQAQTDLDSLWAGLIRGLADRYFEEYCKERNRDPMTKRQRLSLIKERLGHIPVGDLMPLDLDGYVRWRRTHSLKKRQKKISNATINKDLAILKHMMRWAVQRSIITENPIRDFELLKEQRIERPKPTDAIIDAVFAQIDFLVFPVFSFIQETGCRRGEALSLTRNCLQIEDQRALINYDKEGKPKYLFLTDRAIEAIQAQPPASEYVFYNPKTLDRWYDCKKHWERARKAAGYPWLQIKDLRRAYGIRLAESDGVEMHHIQQAMGHSSVRVTERYYAHFSPQSSQERVLKALQGGRKSGRG